MRASCWAVTALRMQSNHVGVSGVGRAMKVMCDLCVGEWRCSPIRWSLETRVLARVTFGRGARAFSPFSCDLYMLQVHACTADGFRAGALVGAPSGERRLKSGGLFPIELSVSAQLQATLSS